MEGVSEDNNAIYVELAAENLSRALKTAQNARALKVKLTNKHFPCLTVSIELVRRGSGRSRGWGVMAAGRRAGAPVTCTPYVRWRWLRGDGEHPCGVAGRLPPPLRPLVPRRCLCRAAAAW